jgi:methionine-rich copper-binding protein CopC
MNNFNRFNLFSIFTALALAIAPVAAFAHAHLTSSSPAKGAIVHTAPNEVTLHFSEELEIAMCKVTVKDLKTGETVSEGAPKIDGSDKSSIKIALKPLKNENADYEVSWSAVSVDSHRMPGKYKFTFESKTK